MRKIIRTLVQRRTRELDSVIKLMKYLSRRFMKSGGGGEQNPLDTIQGSEGGI